MKKKAGIIVAIIAVLVIAAGVLIWGISNGRFFAATFEAKILSIGNDTFLVEPVEGSSELRSSDQIQVPMKNMSPSPEPQVGDIIEIRYNGDIMETYPARLGEVYSIRVTQEAPETVTEHWDLIPMVMVNDELYLDTGYESKMEVRCGMMDGEITSTVEGNQKPTEDNQSNFGTGYGYQYGSTEGTIEIYMNDKWWIFATKDVRQELQFPEEENVANALVENRLTGETVDLSAEDAETIYAILNNDAWNVEGTTDCFSNCAVTIGEETFLYHSDCGTFNDKVKQQYLSLNDEDKTIINGILEKYVSLASEEMPVE